jgi:acid phosphatase (class A)
LKEYYDRPRPSETAENLGIDFSGDDLDTAQSPSYPSGHTIQAYVQAILLSDMFPDHMDSLMRIAELVSQSRVDRGVHFQSDVDFGRKIAYLIAMELLDGSN